MAAALALAAAAGPASASFVHTYASNLGFVFEFETANALANGVESRLVLAPDASPSAGIVQRWSFRYTTPAPSITVSFGSDSVGEYFGDLRVLLGSSGALERICGGGSLETVGEFILSNANSPGGMLTGTLCASTADNFESFNLGVLGGGFTRGLGSWSVREVTVQPPTTPPTSPPTPGRVPEPGSLLLVGAALLALWGARRWPRAAARSTGAR